MYIASHRKVGPNLYELRVFVKGHPKNDGLHSPQYICALCNPSLTQHTNSPWEHLRIPDLVLPHPPITTSYMEEIVTYTSVLALGGR